MIRPNALDLARMLLMILRQLGYWKPANPPPPNPDPDDDNFTTIDQVRNQAVAWHPDKIQQIGICYAHISAFPRFQS